jgi:DNA-binding NarL/FixJ family response regulator
VPLRVYVLQCDPVRAFGLQAVFEDNAGIDIIVEDSSDHAGKGWLDPSVQIVVIGTLSGAGTHKLISSIRSARPDLHILLMSSAAGDETVLTVLGLGARGFLHEATTPAQFEEAIRTVAGGSIWAPRRLQAELINRLLSSRDSHGSVAKVSFTGREQQVLNLLLDGRSNREIAGSLKIEEQTVKSYVTRLLRKMSVKNRTALSVLAMSKNIQ